MNNIMASPFQKCYLERFLKYHSIRYDITIPNIQKFIEKESIRTYERSNLRSMRWDAYYTLEDIEAWMADMAQTYSDVVTPLVAGLSYEGREIKGLKISHGKGKKIIFIEAGIHAREWIVVSTACYIINELLTSTDAETMAAAREFEWYIFPIFNPDGYVWSHTSFRLWRKNRRPVGAEIGVDLNRNWNSNWLVIGASDDPASDHYAGPGPFSEPETRSLSTFIRSLGEINMYLDLHSYRQLLMVPFGNSTGHYSNYYDAVNIGRRAMGALSVRYGTQYVTGNIAEAIYYASGSSIDWVKEHLEVPLVYCYELRDRGETGFLLPADQILPNNEEVMDSILELIHQAKRFGYLNSAVAVKKSILYCFVIVSVTIRYVL